MTDVPSRHALRVEGRGPPLGRQLREKSRGMVQRKRGRLDVDVMAWGPGDNAWKKVFKSLSNSPIEEVLPQRSMWRFPPGDMAVLVVAHPLSARRDGWKGAVF